jgi:RNA polymerase sigma-70 factor (ECF subfamily)
VTYLAEEPTMDTYLLDAEHSSSASGRAATSAIADLEDAASMYLRTRPSLLKIAYRILENESEAEDVVQEVWVRLQCTDRSLVRSPQALLRAITVRLAINSVQSAYRRRERSASPWLPDTLDPCPSPETGAEQRDTVERGVSLLLETLTPRQRAAFVLREGFGYPYERIAGLLHLSVVNARQQVSRAQQRLNGGYPRQPVDSIAHRRLVRAFLAAAQGGDMNLLEQALLADTGSGAAAVRPTEQVAECAA